METDILRSDFKKMYLDNKSMWISTFVNFMLLSGYITSWSATFQANGFISELGVGLIRLNFIRLDQIRY